MRGMLTILLGTIAALPVVTVAEETPWYNVELIVFTPGSGDFRDAEAWPEEFERPDMAQARSLTPAPAKPPGSADALKPFQALTAGEMQLDDTYRRLEASSRFQPLLHLGWRQPGLDRDRAVPVRVTARAGLREPAEAGAPSPSPAQPLPIEEAGLEGTVTLSLSRYLHLETNLVYRFEAADEDNFGLGGSFGEPADAADSDGQRSRFGLSLSREQLRWRELVVRDSRRMRSSELHYLDHPAVGVLSLITPYKLPEPPKAPPEPESAPVEPAVTSPQGGLIQR